MDVLNKGGLSKDNFQDSDASEVKRKEDVGDDGGATGGGKRKISDYFNASLLDGVDVDEWGEDEEFWNEQVPEKVAKMDVDEEGDLE